MAPEESSNSRFSRWLGYSAIFIFLLIILGIALISAGIFDPKPVGRTRQIIKPGRMEVPAGGYEVKELDELQARESQTLRLTGLLMEGETDIGYGLMIGPPSQKIGIGISPLGYLTVWQTNGDSNDTAEAELNIPWRTWPHVRLENEANEIWIDIRGRNLEAIRINRELLWQGDTPIELAPVSIWVESFGESALIDYPKLEVFSP